MLGEVPEQTVHGALAAPYAHVTAPLRRLVDRFGLVIANALENGEEVPAWVLEALPSLHGIMSESDRRANGVERDSADAVEAAVLRDAVGETFEVVVVDRVGAAARGELVVKLLEPAVLTRAGGQARLGRTVPAELIEAEIATSTVRFEVVPHRASPSMGGARE